MDVEPGYRSADGTMNWDYGSTVLQKGNAGAPGFFSGVPTLLELAEEMCTHGATHITFFLMPLISVIRNSESLTSQLVSASRAGHEMGVHIHPDDPALAKAETYNPVFSSNPFLAQLALMRRAKSLISNIVGKTTSIRIGRLAADGRTLMAMALSGFRFDSSLASRGEKPVNWHRAVLRVPISVDPTGRWAHPAYGFDFLRTLFLERYTVWDRRRQGFLVIFLHSSNIVDQRGRTNSDFENLKRFVGYVSDEFCSKGDTQFSSVREFSLAWRSSDRP